MKQLRIEGVVEPATPRRIAPHTCHARGCSTRVPPRLLMCPTHWRQVPRELQRRVWATYVNGQEIRKDPTREYLDAAGDAIAAVVRREARR